MKKSSCSPRKVLSLKCFPITTLRKKSSPKETRSGSEIKIEETLSSKFKSQTCKATKVPLVLKSKNSSLPQSARVSPKSKSTPLLHKPSKTNFNDKKNSKPLKNLIRIKKVSVPKDSKSSKSSKPLIQEVVSQVNIDIYDLPDKLLTNKEIKQRHKEIHKAHLYQTFYGLKLIEDMPKLDSKEIMDKILFLPRPLKLENRKTVIFDLDETLVHCVEGSTGDAEVMIKFPTGEYLVVRII